MLLISRVPQENLFPTEDKKATVVRKERPFEALDFVGGKLGFWRSNL